MEAYSFFKTLFALVFVLTMIGGVGFLIKKFGEKSLGLKLPSNKNLSIEEMMALDHNRRVAVVKYGAKKYVLLLGNHDAVIDVINLKK